MSLQRRALSSSLCFCHPDAESLVCAAPASFYVHASASSAAAVLRCRMRCLAIASRASTCWAFSSSCSASPSSTSTSEPHVPPHTTHANAQRSQAARHSAARHRRSTLSGQFHLLLMQIRCLLSTSTCTYARVSRNKARESDGHLVHTLSDATLPDHPGMSSEQLQLLHHPPSPSSSAPQAYPPSPRGTRDSTHVLLATSMSPRAHAHTRLTSPRAQGSPACSAAFEVAGSTFESSAVTRAGGADGSADGKGTGLITYDAVEMEAISKAEKQAQV
ncbi:unnamed protein product [Closterium sp. NIES-54]